MLSLQSTAEVLIGEHADARTTAREALQLALDTGLIKWIRYANGVLAYIAAAEGDEEACLALAADALGGPVTDRTPAGGTWAHWALALLDLAASGPVRLGTPLTRGVPDVVEALVRLGRRPEAAEALARLENWAARIGQPSSDALVARCRALLATGADAEKHYRQAFELHEEDVRPFEQARTALLYGEWLRRNRRKADARPHLSAALGVFESLGTRRGRSGPRPSSVRPRRAVPPKPRWHRD